ncbi:MAG: SlyX family protein [Planctomycetota bacterium]
MENPRDNQPDEKLKNIEDAQAFADHRMDQLSEQVRSLYQQLTDMTRTMARIERRLGDLESPVELPNPLDERPPHSAG